MTEKKPRYRDVAIDLLRILAICGVVLIHTTTRTIEAAKFQIDTVSWTLFLNQIARFAVPMFFLISGFVLELSYPYHANYWTYLKKRFSRIFIPYLFWSAIYYYIIYTNHTINFLQTLLSGAASYQLYFLPTLLIFYIIFPLIHRWYRIFAHTWILIILGVLQIGLLTLDYYKSPIMFVYPVKIAILNYYIFLLGVVASHHQDRIFSFLRRWKYILIGTTALFAIGIFLQGKILYSQTHNYLMFYSQWRPEVFFYTIFLALVLYYFFHRSKISHPVIHILSSLSFFVFFVHVILLETFWSHGGKSIFLKLHSLPGGLVVWDVFFYLVITGASFLAAWIIHRSRHLVKLTG